MTVSVHPGPAPLDIQRPTSVTVSAVISCGTSAVGMPVQMLNMDYFSERAYGCFAYRTSSTISLVLEQMYPG